MAKKVQYTVRGVSKSTDAALREMAVKEGVSLNTVALSLLDSAAGQSEQMPRSHDLDKLSGSWVQDPGFDKAIKAFEKIDKALWR